MLIQYSTNSQNHILQIFNLNLLESFHDYLPVTLYIEATFLFYFIYLHKYKKIYIYIKSIIFFLNKHTKYPRCKLYEDCVERDSVVNIVSRENSFRVAIYRVNTLAVGVDRRALTRGIKRAQRYVAW